MTYIKLPASTVAALAALRHKAALAAADAKLIIAWRNRV